MEQHSNGACIVRDDYRYFVVDDSDFVDEVRPADEGDRRSLAQLATTNPTLDYLVTKQTELDVMMARSVIGREKEFMAYKLNADVYAALLEKLPRDDWPWYIREWKGSTREQIAAAHNLSEEQIAEAFMYKFRDQLRLLLRTEKYEAAKTKMIAETVVEQFGDDTDRMWDALHLARAQEEEAAARQ